MQYRTQRVAHWYLAMAALLFLLQVVVGLVIASQYIWPDLLQGFFPFNVGRTWHLNLLVLWLVLGFMGATYYIVPEETGQEIWSPGLAYGQLALLCGTGVAALGGFVAANFFPSLWLTEGREYIEAPRWADWLIVVAMLLFVVNNGWSIIKRTKPITATLGVLSTGMVGLALMYLAGMKFFANITMDQFFWWWVVHLWVEGTWELIASALMAFLIMRLTGVDREVVEKWLYIEVSLVLFTGIVGTGHHYYWIGTPSYWLIVGAVFSALEPVPIALMVFDAWRMARLRPAGYANPNPVAFTWAVGSVILHFLGAGVWGFVHTLPQINQWTHGTQITPAHGHFAFYGAYVTLVIALTYYIVPEIKGIAGRLAAAAADPEGAPMATQPVLGQSGLWAFWIITAGVVGMVLSLTVAGIVQVYMERMAGLDFMFVKTTYMAFWFALRAAFGALVVFGVLVYIWDLIRISRYGGAHA